MNNIAIFASGTGSNFLAINEAIQNNELDANIALFVTDRPESKSFENAKKLGLNTFHFCAKEYKSKVDYETEILNLLKYYKVDLIILAGYMRLIGNTILNDFPKRILNIHPSLLPAFKGKDAVGQAMAAKVEVTGVTVHYVDEGMDTGEIITQHPLDISNMISREEIETSIHKIEHKLYPKTIKKVLEGLQ